MSRSLSLRGGLIIAAVVFAAALVAPASALGQDLSENEEFGPVVRSYLGYLRNEQEVVDDRVSRHAVTVAYYRRNSSRIRALRQMAVRIARETQNDYLPELEAVAADEMGLLFERPPRTATLKTGEVLQTTFRYLGVVRAGEPFYVFARLDPYEQAELMEKGNQNAGLSDSASNELRSDPKVLIRARRVSNP
ncbi:MAG TPA: hypothetical protein VGW36_06260 [Pyrinomonadaceae bacterium]|nr:hypothetical protein [Pyrinomonadaceae bacterium]